MNRLLSLFAACLVCGCSQLGYYAQAIGGHLEVMHAAVPIDSILSDPAGDPVLKTRLAEVQAIREFASRKLALPDNGSYRSYADLGRPYVVWDVFAAPEFSLAEKHWCMALVGCVSYRGYYEAQDALTLAAQLRAQGYDTWVGGVPAYSTLGYFDDPVLNTFMRYGPLEVARTIFHELAHQLLFVPGDTVFNESFAATVENEGLRRWLEAHGTAQQRADYAAQRARKAAFTTLVGAYREKFLALYASDGSAEQKRVRKAELFAAMRSDYALLKTAWGGYGAYDAFFAGDLNNARLASLGLYSELVPAFEALLAQEKDDLPRFYQRVARLAKLDVPARRQALLQLESFAGARHPSGIETRSGES